MTDLEYVEIRKKEIKEENLALAPAYYLCQNCDGYGAYLVNDKKNIKLIINLVKHVIVKENLVGCK